jgi:hypothetical protein
MPSPAKAIISYIYTFDNDGANPISPSTFIACQTTGSLSCGDGTIRGSFRYTPSTDTFTNINVQADFELYGQNPLSPDIIDVLDDADPSTIGFGDSTKNPDAAIVTSFQSIIDAGGWGTEGSFQADEVFFSSNANLGTNFCSANALSSTSQPGGNVNSVWLIGREVPSPSAVTALLPLGVFLKLRRRYKF